MTDRNAPKYALSRALCLITKNQLVALFLLPRLVGFVSVGTLASFGAGNSERSLNQFLGKLEVGAVGSISNLILGLFSISGQSSKSAFQKL
ncbi:hypothetical protein VAE151_690047 [Vibrio aestuarianus]|uniref:Uncharacterized protein n=1 Tax=Vibrio aestuarianus TaxID=28171 RepID=A0ABM9FL30_9VIBR|nr:hypothetical protein VAE063_1060006 [Vibrio aestuarianus]CAH8232644.1 conserved hypothetical protein [Vibrio aestuarianus subsp. francensis]CAH8234486.1 hypothetical protein VAE128_530049 [Vibrio aestuarianus]CAH8234524.1 hypothetical protein VAE032_360046 [Vibrio aestuarianus]CAH8234624.1 hypothetical protein VAE055_460045 [Vibrio aestuarianus]